METMRSDHCLILAVLKNDGGIILGATSAASVESRVVNGRIQPDQPIY